MSDEFSSAISTFQNVFRILTSSMTLGFAVNYCGQALRRDLEGLAGFDFSSQFLSFFIKYIVFGNDQKAYKEFNNMVNMTMNLFDVGYLIIIVGIINTYALSDNESNLLAAISFFGLINTISRILAGWDFIQREAEGDCANIWGVGILFQLAVGFTWIVGFGRVLFYEEHGRHCSYPTLSGGGNLCYTSSTIVPYITTAFDIPFPNVGGSNLYDITIKSALMNGAWIDHGPINANLCLLSNVPPSETSQDYIFYIFNSNYTKMVTANFYIDQYTIFAQAVAAGYVTGDYSHSCEEVNSAWLSTSMVSASVATSGTTASYGVFNIVGSFPTTYSVN